MRVETKPVSLLFVVSVVFVGLILAFSSGLLHAQGDGPAEVLTLEELQEQREILAAEAAAAASSVDVATSSVAEIAAALEELAELSNIHQIRLDEATDRYNSAITQFTRATDEHGEVVDAIETLRIFVRELSVAAFTGEANADEFELALSTEPGETARFLYLLGLQFGDVNDSLDQLRVLEIQGEELLAERDAASLRAEEELSEVEFRTSELTAAIAEQETLLEAAEGRLSTELLEADSLTEQADELALLIADGEKRLEDAVRGVGAPAPVNREDIVQLTFFEGDGTVPVFRIQVHKDIEEQTRGLFELAFSQGINLGGWGYRDTERQIQLRESHCGSSSYDIWLRPASQCSPPTARPGFSKHEQGRAIDFQWNGGSIGPRSGQAFQWLAANAPQFGFVNLPSEPWHWSDGSGITFDPTVPIPDIPEDAFVEAEPDAETAHLLSELADLEQDVEDGEVIVDLDADAADEDLADPSADEPGDVEAGGEQGTHTEGASEVVEEAAPSVADQIPEPNGQAEEPSDPAASDAAPTEAAPEQNKAEESVAEEPAAEDAISGEVAVEAG